MHDCELWQNANWFPYLNNTNTLGKMETRWSDNMSYWRETLYIFQSFNTRRKAQISFEKQINHYLLLSLHLANLTYMWSESYLPTLNYFTEGDAQVHLNLCENPLPSKKKCTVVDNWSPIEGQSICIQVSSHFPLHHLLPPSSSYWIFIPVIQPVPLMNQILPFKGIEITLKFKIKCSSFAFQVIDLFSWFR